MQHKGSKMSKKSSVIARKAWEVLRAVLRSRKGEFSLNIDKLVKKFVHSSNEKESRRALLYGDHEFSFRNTPLVHVRMTRPPSALRFIRMPHIPCITPRPDFHDEDDAVAMRSAKGEITETEGSDDEGIDERAEEFIAKFYEEIKLQTQISCL